MQDDVQWPAVVKKFCSHIDPEPAPAAASSELHDPLRQLHPASWFDWLKSPLGNRLASAAFAAGATPSSTVTRAKAAREVACLVTGSTAGGSRIDATA
jgi:hypothetical protein